MAIGKSSYSKGVTMLVISGLCLSVSGIALRNIESADGWQILFYRALAFTFTVLLYLCFRKDFRAREVISNFGWNDLLFAVVQATGFVAFVFALLHTTVANALFIFSAAPLVAAILGWLILKEQVPRGTWIAIGVAMLGLMVMVGNGIAAGRSLGNAIALWVPISYAITVILIRRSNNIHMLPALCVAGVVTAVISLFFVHGFSISLRDLSLSLFLGVFEIGFGFILLVLGARFVPAAKVGLLALVEPLCAPVWVWLGVGEVPGTFTFIGGALILLAIMIDAIFRMRE